MKLKTEKDFGGYWVKYVQNFKGHEQEPLFHCFVYRNGKRVGFFSEDPRGGQAHLDMINRKEEEDLREFAKQRDPNPWEESYHKLIVDIIKEVATQKLFKKMCKNKTLIRLIEDEEGAYRVLEIEFSKKVKEFLIEKFEDRLETVINELFYIYNY